MVICNFMQDVSESLVVVGRYISENFNGVALHPIDFIDITTGQLVAEVMDPNITTISPVNKLHPRDDVLASGSSRFVYHLFTSFVSIIPCRCFLRAPLNHDLVATGLSSSGSPKRARSR